MTHLYFHYFKDCEDGKMAHFETTGEERIPINVFIDNYENFRDALEGPCQMDIYGMGSDIEVFASEEEYYASKYSAFSAVSMIPIGSFVPYGENEEARIDSPHILFSGRVLDVDRNPEPKDGEPDYLVYVETLEFDFYLYCGYCGHIDNIEPGNIIYGVAWLFGDLDVMSNTTRFPDPDPYSVTMDYPIRTNQFYEIKSVISKLRDIEGEFLVVALENAPLSIDFIQTTREENSKNYLIEIGLKTSSVRPVNIYRLNEAGLEDTIDLFKEVCMNGELPDLSKWSDVTEEVFTAVED